MRSVIFPYTLYKSRWAPIIPVPFRGPRGWIPIWTYVDSGASFSILAVASAERLGLEMTQGHLTHVAVGDGSLIPVYIHRLLIRVSHHAFLAHVGFSPRLGIGFDLLGRQDIFTHFDVTFSDSTRRITFRPRPR